MSELTKDIRKVAQCVYLACDSDVASDIAVKCKKIADSHDKLTEQNKILLLDIATLKKSIGSAVVVIENESDMDKASSLLTRALADTEDFK